MNNEEIKQEIDPKELVENRKNRRLFIAFLIVDVFVLALIIYEIVMIIRNGVIASNEAKKAAETAANVVEQIKLLI